jgi:plasmid stabilization system protein ParE
MSRARLSPRAERDLEGIRDFIAADNLEAAERFFYRPFQDTIMVVRILRAAQDWTRVLAPL